MALQYVKIHLTQFVIYKHVNVVVSCFQSTYFNVLYAYFTITVALCFTEPPVFDLQCALWK